jgi:hypothetical protein
LQSVASNIRNYVYKNSDLASRLDYSLDLFDILAYSRGGAQYYNQVGNVMRPRYQ